MIALVILGQVPGYQTCLFWSYSGRYPGTTLSMYSRRHTLNTVCSGAVDWVVVRFGAAVRWQDMIIAII